MTQPDTLAKLAACPFCGKTDSPEIHEAPYPGQYHAVCNYHKGGCGATVCEDSEQEAIDRWNRRALAAQAPTMPAEFAPRLMAVVKIYQEQAALGIAVDAELFRAVSRLVAAQALPAAEPVKLDVMPIFWKCFRNFPSTAGALTHTVWKDGIDIDKLSAPMQSFCDALIQAAQQSTQSLPAESPTKQPMLWCISIPGPDEHCAAPSLEAAVHMKQRHNAAMAEHFERNPDPEGMGPLRESCLAEVRAWSWSAQAHAVALLAFDAKAWGWPAPQAAQQAAQAPAVSDAVMLQQAYRRGFLRCAAWAGRDDLEHDVGSPAYLKDQASDLMQLSAALHQPPQPQEDAA